VIRTEARGHVVVLALDRPERRNAVDLATLEALAAELAACGEDVRALVVTGAGGHFCAGADLTGVEDAVFADRLWTVLDGLRTAPFVTIAAADGRGARCGDAAGDRLRPAGGDAPGQLRDPRRAAGPGGRRLDR